MNLNFSKALRCISLVLPFCLIVFYLLIIKEQEAYAGTYDNAYSFYSTYGNRMCFVASTESDGNIYYATRAKRSSSNILFSNIGWKATIYNGSGTVLQEVYYKLGGNYLKTTDIRTAADGYEYSLYAVSLSDFKSRLNNSALKTLESGNCDIVFDACIIIKRNGVPSGSMTDNGISGSGVYTTYAGIVNAEQWSTTTTNSLLSYYDKGVEGLFHTLYLNKDSGIETVSGAGRYCYGTRVTISAAARKGNKFSCWSGEKKLLTAKSSIVITKTLTYTACSERENLTVTYYRNWDMQDGTVKKQVFSNGAAGQTMTDCGWSKTGYYQTGWKHKRTGLGADYGIKQSVSVQWIESYAPSLILYANWSPNRYTIVFDKNMAFVNVNNGAAGNQLMQDRDVNYTTKFKIPECEYQHPKATFLGWSLKADAVLPEYRAQDEVAVSGLAQALDVENSDGAQIVLYAVWDQMPAIAVEDIYVPLKSAQEGKITEEWLFSFACATDKEDGEIAPGKHENNYFLLPRYNPAKYTKAVRETSFSEIFSVKDSAGNICNRSIRVHLVDTSSYSEEKPDGDVRFISKEYFLNQDGNLLSREEGGLDEDSIWRCDETFLELLRQVLEESP